VTSLLTPFSVFVDHGTGDLIPDLNVQERRLSDMRRHYLDAPSDDHQDQTAYVVHQIDVPATSNNLLSSTTTLYPGKVGREFFMTKGHFHKIRDRAEIYFSLSGEGRLVMATEDGRSHVEEMRPGVANYVPGGWAHRSVNTGDKPLVFYAVYIGDAGYDYATIEEHGFPVLVIDGDNGPEVVDNPRYVRP